MGEHIFNIDKIKWLHDLYVHAPMAIGIYTGKNYVIEFANPMMCAIWGRTKEEVINRPLFEALPEVQEQGFEEILAKVITLGEPFIGNELPVTLAKHQKIQLYYFNIIYKPLKNDKNETVGIIQLAHDVTDFVEARRNVENNEEVLKVALEAAKMATWYYDFIQKKVSRSRGHDLIYGQEEVPEWNFDFFIAQVVKEERASVKAQIVEGFKNGLLDVEAQIQWPDKSLHCILLKGKVAYNLKREPVSVAGVVIDITDQKKNREREKQLAMAQAAQKEAERQGKMLENLFMKAPVLICSLIGPQHVFDLVNPLYQQLFSGRKLKGKPVVEALPELMGQPFKAMLDSVYTTGKSFIGNEIPLEFDRNNTGKLETGYFNFVYQANRNTAGEISGILVFAYEVTEQILSRNKVERSEENLKIALEAGKMGAWQMDFVQKTSTHSEQFDKVFGYRQPVPKWGYKLFMKHIPAKLRLKVAHEFRKARATGELDFETQIQGVDQKTRWIAMKGRMFFENGQTIAMAGIVQDISERREAEERLKQLTEDLATNNEELKAASEEIQSRVEEITAANQQLQIVNADLDNFIYAASHDLKAPIANIEGLMNLLVKNITDDVLEKDIVKKIIGSIDTSIDRFKKTINELTDIAKVQKQMDEEILINIAEIVQEVLLDLETLIKEEAVNIQTDVEDCTAIDFSHKNMKSILYNLISNAIKYRSPDREPHVVLSCKTTEKDFLLSVRDNGLGMKKKDLNKIFSMFIRLHTHVEGMGVGLYLVKRIVDNAKGRLEVESQEGQGTTFKVLLPLARKK